MATAAVNQLADGLESFRLLLPSSQGISSIISNTMESTAASASLYNSTLWSQRGDCSKRLSHVMTPLQLSAPAATQLDHLNHQLLTQSLVPGVKTLPTWAETCRTAAGKLAAARLISEHLLWLQGFVCLLKATVSQLRLLLALPAGLASNATHKPPFWQLWQLIVVNSQVLVHGPLKDWPLHHLQSNAPLLAAMGTLMDLVLEVQRAPPKQAMFADSQEEWDRNVQVVICTPLQCLHQFTVVDLGLRMSSGRVRLAVPPSLVARVCCIACHQLEQDLAQPRNADSTLSWEDTAIGPTWLLLGTLFDCVQRVAEGERAALSMSVMGPAGVEAIKHALLTCARYPANHWRKFLSSPTVVINLLSLCLQSDSSGGDISAASGTSNSRSSSSSKHTDPVPINSITGDRVLYALRWCSVMHPSCAYAVNIQFHEDSFSWRWPGPQVQVNTLQWVQPVPPESVLQHLKKIFHHVGLQTVWWMLQQQKVQLACKQVKQAVGTQLFAEKQRLHALALRNSLPTLEACVSVQNLLLNLLEQAKDVYPRLDSDIWYTEANRDLLYQCNPGRIFSNREVQLHMRRQAQRRIHAMYSPNHRIISGLGQLPGIFHLAEASVRSATEDPDLRLQVALQALNLMGQVQVSGAVTFEVMASCASLATTARKLRLLHLDAWAAGWATRRSDQITEALMCMDMLLLVLTDVHFWVVEEGSLARREPGSLLSVGATHRLQVLALLTLAWVDERNTYVRLMCKRRHQAEIEPVQLPMHHHPDACHTRLNALTLESLLQQDGRPLVGIPSKAEHDLRLATAWTDFARTYLRGRLFPGCCHFGCTNVDGVSEAALPTQLCSGCRRVRYCSVTCQREAWMEGGHKLVCGKGKWAKEGNL